MSNSIIKELHIIFVLKEHLKFCSKDYLNDEWTKIMEIVCESGFQTNLPTR